MLKLLEHSIAMQDRWSVYEKSLRWSVVLMAWWGSFRIGELLPKFRHQFDANKDLLASDIKFNQDSVSIWLWSPKYEASPTGDIVEVWRVKDRKDLDPVSALPTFMENRKGKFGEAENLPLFLHESGHIFLNN